MNINKLNEINLFKAVVLIKLINGLFEISGSLILFFVSAPHITKLIKFIFRGELAEDSKDFLVQFFLNHTSGSLFDAKSVIAIYLMAYGLINFGLAYILLTKKVKHYIFVEGILIALIIYQTYNFLHSHSSILLAFVLINILITMLIFKDHKKLLKV